MLFDRREVIMARRSRAGLRDDPPCRVLRPLWTWIARWVPCRLPA